MEAVMTAEIVVDRADPILGAFSQNRTAGSTGTRPLANLN